jgi:hypothetical protein
MFTPYWNNSIYPIWNVQVKQRLFIAIIPLKISFLKGTDSVFSRRYGKLSSICKPSLMFNEGHFKSRACLQH